jgi:hypothetical protein
MTGRSLCLISAMQSLEFSKVTLFQWLHFILIYPISGDKGHVFVPFGRHTFSFISKTKTLQGRSYLLMALLINRLELRTWFSNAQLCHLSSTGGQTGLPSDYCRPDLHPGPHLHHSLVVQSAKAETER